MAYSVKTRDADFISDQVFEYILFINMFTYLFKNIVVLYF